MKKLQNFEKITTEKNETLKAYFTLLNGEKVYAAFNSPERVKLYEANGNLENLTKEEIFKICGKHLDPEKYENVRDPLLFTVAFKIT